VNYLTFIKKTRGLRHVNRFTQNPSIKSNNVAEHSYYVALYTDILCSECDDIDDVMKANALVYAIHHDTHEGVSVELPANVKRKNKEHCRAIEEEATRELYTGSLYADDRVQAIVKVADLLDVILYAAEEISMGNTFYRTIVCEVLSILHQVLIDTRNKFNIDMYNTANHIIVSLGLDFSLGIDSDMESTTHIHKELGDIGDKL